MRERHDTGGPSVSLLRRMARFDDLPADQKAVLQLVLRQGRTYAEIATLLKISDAAVQNRALTALDAIGPSGLEGLDDERQDEVGDYLLGQQSASERAATRDFLEASQSGRDWARAVAADLRGAGVAGEDGLPEIPADAGRGRRGLRRAARPPRRARRAAALLAPGRRAADRRRGDRRRRRRPAAHRRHRRRRRQERQRRRRDDHDVDRHRASNPDAARRPSSSRSTSTRPAAAGRRSASPTSSPRTAGARSPSSARTSRPPATTCCGCKNGSGTKFLGFFPVVTEQGHRQGQAPGHRRRARRPRVLHGDDHQPRAVVVAQDADDDRPDRAGSGARRLAVVQLGERAPARRRAACAPRA